MSLRATSNVASWLAQCPLVFLGPYEFEGPVLEDPAGVFFASCARRCQEAPACSGIFYGGSLSTDCRLYSGPLNGRGSKFFAQGHGDLGTFVQPVLLNGSCYLASSSSPLRLLARCRGVQAEWASRGTAPCP